MKIKSARTQRNVLGKILIVVTCTGMGIYSQATVIPISDPDFASSTFNSSWSPSGGASVSTPSGIFAANLTAANIPGYNGGVASLPGNASIFQITTATLVAGATYTISGYVANPSSSSLSSSGINIFVYTLGNGTPLTQVGGNSYNDPYGQMTGNVGPLSGLNGYQVESFSASFTVGSSVPSGYTGDLEIQFSGFGTGADIDDIAFITTAVPEKENEALLLFGILAFGGIATRRWIGRNVLRSEAVGL
jgi:hypothetical protein